jgi:hypothetical protein
MAAQVVVATTATPFHGRSVPTASVRTTCFTPLTAFAFVSSTLATFPPNTGERSTAA